MDKPSWMKTRIPKGIINPKKSCLALFPFGGDLTADRIYGDPLALAQPRCWNLGQESKKTVDENKQPVLFQLLVSSKETKFAVQFFASLLYFEQGQWGYSIHHCGSAGNAVYSNPTWIYFPERLKSPNGHELTLLVNSKDAGRNRKAPASNS